MEQIEQNESRLQLANERQQLLKCSKLQLAKKCKSEQLATNGKRQHMVDRLMKKYSNSNVLNILPSLSYNFKTTSLKNRRKSKSKQKRKEKLHSRQLCKVASIDDHFKLNYNKKYQLVDALSDNIKNKYGMKYGNKLNNFLINEDWTDPYVIAEDIIDENDDSFIIDGMIQIFIDFKYFEQNRTQHSVSLEIQTLFANVINTFVYDFGYEILFKDVWFNDKHNESRKIINDLVHLLYGFVRFHYDEFVPVDICRLFLKYCYIPSHWIQIKPEILKKTASKIYTLQHLIDSLCNALENTYDDNVAETFKVEMKKHGWDNFDNIIDDINEGQQDSFVVDYAFDIVIDEFIIDTDDNTTPIKQNIYELFKNIIDNQCLKVYKYTKDIIYSQEQYIKIRCGHIDDKYILHENECDASIEIKQIINNGGRNSDVLLYKCSFKNIKYVNTDERYSNGKIQLHIKHIGVNPSVDITLKDKDTHFNMFVKYVDVGKPINFTDAEWQRIIK